MRHLHYLKLWNSFLFGTTPSNISSKAVFTRLDFRRPLGSGRVRSVRARVGWARTHFPKINRIWSSDERIRQLSATPTTAEILLTEKIALSLESVHRSCVVSHLVRDPVVAGFNTCSSKYWRTNRTRSSRDGKPNSTISSNLSLIAQSNWSGWLLARTSINLQANTEKQKKKT